MTALGATAIAIAMVATALTVLAHPGVAGASPVASALAPAAAVPAAAGPATQVAPASNLNDPGPTLFGTITVVPAPAGYDPNATMSVVVTLKPTAELAKAVAALSDPASSHFRQYLGPAGIGAVFGVSHGAYASAVQYFQGYGLSVRSSSTLLSLSVGGTVDQVSAAFHTRLAAFQLEYTSNGVWNPTFGNTSATAGVTVSGPAFYANTQPADLPASLAAIVGGISGLDSMPAQPNLVMPYGLAPGAAGLSGAPTGNVSMPDWRTSCSDFPYGCTDPIDSGVGYQDGNFLWTTGAAIGASDVTDWQFLFPSTMPYINGAAQSLWSGAATIMSEPDLGQGITIAVVEVGCALPDDLAAFSDATFGSANQLLDRLTQIGLTDPSGDYPNTNLSGCIANGMDWGWTLETELDIEYAATMAPMAHIDLVAAGSAYFSAFDNAYVAIADYLTSMSPCAIPPSVATIVAGPVAGACSVSITSNSYGAGEQYMYFYGSPVYVTATDTLLEILNLEGVTNFFASGDSGGTYLAVNDFASASSPGSTSVGGGMVTAAGPGGAPFPVTNDGFKFCTGPSYRGCCNGTVGVAYWAPAQGLANFTYWAYAEGSGGTAYGATGGGFGQSLAEPQEWWQNGLDTYSAGARLDPVISEAAAYNMTIYGFGEWNFFYGGTSFATPIVAGEWALIEEQANLALGNPKLGDVNPILYAAHNGQEAGVASLGADPYAPMLPMGHGFDWAAVNAYTWYYDNLSIQNPTAPTQAFWFVTLYNPAGSGWNYLQGLGMPLEPTLDNALFGQTGIAGHALALPAFSVLENNGGTLVPFSTLVGGVSYSFAIVPAGVYNVVRYSGGPNDGTYGGGATTTFQTGADGTFSYAASVGAAPGGDGATTYGYFLVTSVVGGASAAWTFAPFAVAAPTPTGTLSLCVVDTYGLCQDAIAEVPMFTTEQVGSYNLFAQAQVTLDGRPVPNAMVTQVSVQSQFGVTVPTVPPGYFAPGMTIGHTLTDFRGTAQFWPAPLGLAEVNGTLRTQIYLLSATYDGLDSNTVPVYVEPQGGSFFSDLQLVGGDDAPTATLVGTVQAADMKYLDFLNVSVGSAPGQYENWTCPLPGAFEGVDYGFAQPPDTMPFPAPPMNCQPYYDANPDALYEYPVDVWNVGIWTSGFSNVQVSVNLTPPTSGPVVVSLLAGGTNDLSFIENYCYADGCFYYETDSIQYPIYWQDPLVFLPTQLSASASGSMTGAVTFAYAGTEYPSAVGQLELVSAAGTQLLATGLSGTYTLDTAGLADGPYRVVYAETAPGAAPSERSVTFYAANQATAASALVTSLESQLAADASTIAELQAQTGSLETSIASLEAQVAALRTSLDAANANLAELQSALTSVNGQVAALESQVAGLTSQVSTLETDLAAAQNNAAALEAQITALEAANATVQAQIGALQGELDAANAQISADATQLAADQTAIHGYTAQIASLQDQVASLQSALDAKKDYVAPAWYDTRLGSTFVVLIACAGAAVGAVAVYAGMRRRRSPVGAPSEAGGHEPAATGGVEVPASGGPAAAGVRRPEEVFRRARAARLELLREGNVRAAARLEAATEMLGRLVGGDSFPEGPPGMYR